MKMTTNEPSVWMLHKSCMVLNYSINLTEKWNINMTLKNTQGKYYMSPVLPFKADFHVRFNIVTFLDFCFTIAVCYRIIQLADISLTLHQNAIHQSEQVPIELF